MPRVSVIMPVYNSAPFLRESVTSVLDQSFRDFELIGVDDGSSDQSWEILQSFEYDKRVKAIRLETNQGAANARNSGVAMSDSDYLAFLDSDDLAKPHRLEVQVQAIEKGRRFDLVYGRAEVVHNGGRFLASSETVSPDGVPSKLLFRNCIVQSSVLLRRSRWQVFRTEFEPAEDYDLWARLGPSLSFLPLNEVLVDYREHPQGVSKRLPDRMNQAVAAIHEFQLERIGVRPRVELHRRLTAWPGNADANELAEAEAWLLELATVNRIYHPTSFRRVIEAIWFSICLDSWSLGPKGFNIYNRSSLAQLTPGRLWHFMRRFGRRALFSTE
ncbi:MAG TPA: glycosyltransferase [Chthoniobacterales bacterium]|nr:glycosyltransferase [Chthoniobacterales bacterium]